MGLFKQFKDLKDTIAAAPSMVEQAQQMKANAEALQAAQTAQANAANAAAASAAATAAQGNPDFEPINGVSLELYAEISRGLAAVNYDQSQVPMIAASKGVMADDWEAAMNGWNDRIRANPAVAKRFNALYMGRA